MLLPFYAVWGTTMSEREAIEEHDGPTEYLTLPLQRPYIDSHGNARLEDTVGRRRRYRTWWQDGTQYGEWWWVWDAWEAERR